MEEDKFEKINLENIFNQLNINKIRPNEMKIESVLAAGGQGKVLLCDYYGTKVILKTLHRLSTKDYTNEVLNVYKYRHPNTPKFIGIYDCPKHYGLVFEFVEGITLAKQIQLERNGVITLSFIQKLDYMIQLCSVIELLHDHELIHRDLKTQNVMIDNLGNLKLLDFGIAIDEKKGMNMNLESTDFALTPTYIPPEIMLQNEEEDDFSDDDEDDKNTNIPKSAVGNNIANNINTNNRNSRNLFTHVESSMNNYLTNNSNMTSATNTTNTKSKASVKINFQKLVLNYQRKKDIYNINNKPGYLNSNKGAFLTNNFSNLNSSINTFNRSSIRYNTGIKTNIPSYNKNINESININTLGGNLTNNYRKNNFENYYKNFQNDENKTTINITNKYDIWTIGLIISEYFTLIRPWTINKQKESRSDIEIRALIIKRCPFFTPIHNEIEDPEAYKVIETTIKKCTNYDPEKRPKIHEIRKDLTELFNKEVIKLRRIEDGKKFNLGNKKEDLSQVELLKYKKGLLRSHNETFYKAKVKELLGSKEMLKFPNLKMTKIDTENLIQSVIVDTIKKGNLFKQQQISVYQQKIFFDRKILNENQSSISQTEHKYNNVLFSSLINNYYYSTYNELEDSLVITKFPEETLKVIPEITKLVFGNLAKLKYRNPFCLNTEYGFFLIGGLVIEENEINSTLQSLSETSSYSATYKKMFGDNYFSTNKCFMFDYSKMKLKFFPFLNSHRLFFGAAVVNGAIWVIGGGNRRCEILNLKEYYNNLENEKFHLKWCYSSELEKDVVDPMISYVGDFIIVIDGRQSYSNIESNGGYLEYQYLNVSKNCSFDKLKNKKFKLGKVKVDSLDFFNIQFFVGTFNHDSNEESTECDSCDNSYCEGDCDSCDEGDNKSKKSIYLISRYSLSHNFEFGGNNQTKEKETKISFAKRDSTYSNNKEEKETKSKIKYEQNASNTTKTNNSKNRKNDFVFKFTELQVVFNAEDKESKSYIYIISISNNI